MCERPLTALTHKMSENIREQQLAVCKCNVEAFGFVLLQLRFGRRGLPLAEGPGQGPVHSHHRGERSWENW